jgi:hypothetical protein
MPPPPATFSIILEILKILIQTNITGKCNLGNNPEIIINTFPFKAIYPVNLVLNQDLQDFEDFLALDIGLDGARSSMLFESGFTGFRGLTITPLV